MTSNPEYKAALTAAASYMKEHDDFLVVSHVSPDGDAASSTCAIGYILQALGKKFIMINEGPLPNKFDFLWGFNQVIRYDNDAPQRTYTTIISIDCADFARIGNVKTLFADGFQLLNIDHHPTNDGFGSVQLIDPNAAATVEIIHDLAVELGIDLNTELSTCLYTGLLTDTGGFRYSNTTPKVMRIASDLLSRNVKGSFIAEQVLEKLTFAQITMIRKALATLSFNDSKSIAWMTVSKEDVQETGVQNEDLDGLVNYPRNIEGVEVGILFKQWDEGAVKVSLRSNGDIDVAQIAKSLGGGGHVKAAGCAVEGTLQEVVSRVVKEVGSKLE